MIGESVKERIMMKVHGVGEAAGRLQPPTTKQTVDPGGASGKRPRAPLALQTANGGEGCGAADPPYLEDAKEATSSDQHRDQAILDRKLGAIRVSRN